MAKYDKFDVINVSGNVGVVLGTTQYTSVYDNKTREFYIMEYNNDETETYDEVNHIDEVASYIHHLEGDEIIRWQRESKFPFDN